MVHLVQAGFPYDAAVHMAPRDTDKFLAIATAVSISPEDRRGGVVAGTKADFDKFFGG